MPLRSSPREAPEQIPIKIRIGAAKLHAEKEGSDVYIQFSDSDEKIPMAREGIFFSFSGEFPLPSSGYEKDVRYGFITHFPDGSIEETTTINQFIITDSGEIVNVQGLAEISKIIPELERKAKVSASANFDSKQERVRLLQEAFRDLYLQAHGPLMLEREYDRENLDSLHKMLDKTAGQIMALASSENHEVCLMLKGEAMNLFTEAQDQWIRERKDIGGSAKEMLGSQDGRLQFRISTFNKLCRKGNLGLSDKDRFKIRVGHPPSEEEVIVHMQRKLRENWRVFDLVCSSFDGGNIRRSVASAFHATQEYSRRGESRGKLARRVAERMRNETKDIHALEMQRSKSKNVARWIEDIGDLAIKGGAVGLLFAAGINPYTLSAAGLLWTLRGISEGIGYDFGSVLKKGLKSPGSLFDSLRRNIKKEAKASETIPRASLNFKQRIQLFFRGISPVPPILIRLPFGWGEKIEKIVPGSELEAGEIAMRQHESDEPTVEQACREVLGMPSTTHATPQGSPPAGGNVNTHQTSSLADASNN